MLKKRLICHCESRSFGTRNLLGELPRSKESIRRGGLGSAKSATPRNDSPGRLFSTVLNFTSGGQLRQDRPQRIGGELAAMRRGGRQPTQRRGNLPISELAHVGHVPPRNHFCQDGTARDGRHTPDGFEACGNDLAVHNLKPKLHDVAASRVGHFHLCSWILERACISWIFEMLQNGTAVKTGRFVHELPKYFSSIGARPFTVNRPG